MVKESIVNHILENIAFEVEAFPKENIIQLTNAANTTPLNVKIKVRKKTSSTNEVYLRQGFISGESNSPSQRIKLVNSDHTIVSFNIFMEAEIDSKDLKKKSSKQKHFFENLFSFKPGGCLGTRGNDVDDYPYMPSASKINENINENITRSDSQILNQTFPLSNEVPYQITPNIKPKMHKGLFRNCKHGGCLDPPFSEDKYSYRPLYRPQNVEGKSNDMKVDTLNEQLITNKEYLRMKRKQEVDSTEKETKKEQMDDKSVLSLRDPESSLNLKYFDSIITYPTILPSSNVSGKNIKIKRNSDEEKCKKIYNELNHEYFIPSKNMVRHKTLNNLDQCSENDSIPLKCSSTNIQISSENKTKDGGHENNISRCSLTDNLHARQETFTYLNGLYEKLNSEAALNRISKEYNNLETQTKYLKIGNGFEESKCYKDLPETKIINVIHRIDVQESVTVTKTHEITMTNYNVASALSNASLNKADAITNVEIEHEISQLPLLDIGTVKEKKSEVALDIVIDNISMRNFENEILSNKYIPLENYSNIQNNVIKSTEKNTTYIPSEDYSNIQNNVIKSTEKNITLNDDQINQHTRQDPDIMHTTTIPYFHRRKSINIEEESSDVKMQMKISPKQSRNIIESSSCKIIENASMGEFPEKFVENISSFMSNINQVGYSCSPKEYVTNDIISPENKNKSQASDDLQLNIFTDSIVFENDALLESVKNLVKMQSKEIQSAVVIKKPQLINSDMSNIHEEVFSKNKLLKRQSLTVIDPDNQLQKDIQIIQNRSDNNLVDNQTDYKQRSSKIFLNKEQVENIKKLSNQTFEKSVKSNQNSPVNNHTSLKLNKTSLKKSDEKLSTSVTSFADNCYQNTENSNSNNSTHGVESSNKMMDRLSTTSLYEGKLNNANFTPYDKINVNNRSKNYILMKENKNYKDQVKHTNAKNTSNASENSQIVEQKELSLSYRNDSDGNLKSEIDRQIETTPHYYYKNQSSQDNTNDSKTIFHKTEKKISPTFLNENLPVNVHKESPDIKDTNQKINQFIDVDSKENNIYVNEMSATKTETSGTKMDLLSLKPSLIKMHEISKLDSNTDRNLRTEINNTENMQSFSFIKEPYEELLSLPYYMTYTSEFVKPVTKFSTSSIDKHKKTDTESQIKNTLAENNVITTLILSPVNSNENRNQSLSQALTPVEPITEKKSFNRLDFINKEIDIDSTFSDYDKKYISELTTDESKKSSTIIFNNTEIPTVIETQKTPVTNTFTNTQDTLLLDLAFHRYLNDNKERVLKTVEFDHKLSENVNENVIFIKSAIKSDTGEICVPIDSRNDITINFLKKLKQDELDDIHKAKFIIDDAQHKLNKSKHSHVINVKDLRNNNPNFKLHSQIEHNDDKIIHEALTMLYEKELIPLHHIIQNLKEEIDGLAKQQEILTNHFLIAKKTTSKRLIHVNKRCGCVRR